MNLNEWNDFCSCFFFLQMCNENIIHICYFKKKVLFQEGEHVFTEVRMLHCQETKEMYTDATKPNKVPPNYKHIICKRNQSQILHFIFIFPLSELPVGEAISILFF